MPPISGELSIDIITFIISNILDKPNTQFRLLLILAKTCKQLQYSISNVSSLNLSHSVNPYRLFNYSFKNLSQLRYLNLSGIICTNKEISHIQRAMIISSLIHLKTFKYNNNNPRLLRLCLQNLPNLEALYLSYVDIGKYGDILSSAIKKLTCHDVYI